MSRLLSLSHGGGCGCKLSPTELAEVLRTVRPTTGQEPAAVLRGLVGLDDAAIVNWAGGALVLTCDFFTPIVDDPRAWGRIAAANALSDVYAMGGQPRFALNILAWPRDGSPIGALGDVLAGGLETLAQAGALLVGGHSIDDQEPKYGLAVVGSVDPARMLSNGAGRPGDLLVLTKPLGVGAVATAAKHQRAPAEVIEAAILSMSQLNRGASEVATNLGLEAATDVTGFGLAGHAHELADASGVAVELWADAVPRLHGIEQLLRLGFAPSGTSRNIEACSAYTDWSSCGAHTRELLCDPQSSGGLLLAVPPDKCAAVQHALRGAGCLAADVVGQINKGPIGHVHIRP